MDKLKMMSMDRTSENIEKIRAIFPNCVTEVLRDGKEEYAIDFDMLRQELSKDIVEGREERYQMTWPDKKKAILLANSQINKTLRPCREESVDFDNTENLYIEGDNLEVLKLLQETYLGKVKMIYIDPPYNTGNDSFVYNDIYSMDEEDFKKAGGYYNKEGNRVIDVKENSESNGRFHTDWLNMIYPRLKIARDLLSDDGVIFISIDDNEQANLKKVCDEVFGEDNFIGQWNWFKSATPPNLSYKIKKNIEYVLCYEKKRDNVKYKGLNKVSNSNDPFTKPQNSYKILTFPPHSIKTNLADGVYKQGIYGTDKFPNELINDLIVENGYNKNEVSFKNRFIWIQETLNQNIKENLDIFLSKALVLSYKKKNYLPECPPNFIDKSVGVDTTEQAGKDLENLFNVDVFDYPKAVSLLTYLLEFKGNKEDIVLDFFSGSATTAHAVMQLNAEDGGNRKFIMVQLPEACDEKSEAYKAGYKNICEIGKERIRRAGKKIKEENPLATANLDTGFRVLKLDSSNMRDVFYKPEELTQMSMLDTQDNIKPDRSAEDLLFQVMLDMGAPLSAKIEQNTVCGKQVFTVADNYLMACFEDNLAEDVITTIAKQQPLYAVFRDSSFATDSVAKNVEQIFATYSPDTKLSIL